MKDLELIECTEALLEMMAKDMHDMYEKQKADRMMEDIQFCLEEGNKFIKLIRYIPQNYNPRSCIGFIVKKAPKALDNKTNKPFNVGDMLMAKSWKAPATNFARGNVFNLGTNYRWTGI